MTESRRALGRMPTVSFRTGWFARLVLIHAGLLYPRAGASATESGTTVAVGLLGLLVIFAIVMLLRRRRRERRTPSETGGTSDDGARTERAGQLHR